MQVKLHYKNDDTRELYINAGIKTSGSAGYDLVSVADIEIGSNSIGKLSLIDLGVIIKVPKGFHCLLLPRSSMFKKWGIVQANSIGLIDNDYCGEKDYWKLATSYLGSYGKESRKHANPNGSFTIPKGTPLCQFIIQKTIVIDEVIEFDPSNISRGGFGSTDERVKCDLCYYVLGKCKECNHIEIRR